MGNYNLEIKHTFLTFAQALFAQHSKYTWDVDPTKTKVLIVDKYALDLKVIEKKRSIVLSRGSYGYSNLTFNYLAGGEHETLMDRTLIGDHYTDMIRGSVTYSCLAQNGMVAEELAHLLFVNLAGRRDQFKKNGISKLTNINIGEETVLKSDSNVSLASVPIYVQFDTQKSLSTGFDFYDFYITDATGAKYYQGADYSIDISDNITFFTAPIVDTVLTAHYTHNITLATIEELLIGTVDGSNTIFTVSHPIYTQYDVFEDKQITVSGHETV